MLKSEEHMMAVIPFIQEKNGLFHVNVGGVIKRLLNTRFKE
jgi:hypothetical protein